MAISGGIGGPVRQDTSGRGDLVAAAGKPRSAPELPIGKVGGRQTGTASTYGHGDGWDGKPTANGETLDTNAVERHKINGVDTPVYTAAHPTLPFGTLVRATHVKGGVERSIVARINNRGPYTGGRIIDFSFAGAKALGIGNSIGRVTIENIGHTNSRGSAVEPAGRTRQTIAEPRPSAFAPMPPLPAGRVV